VVDEKKEVTQARDAVCEDITKVKKTELRVLPINGGNEHVRDYKKRGGGRGDDSGKGHL